MRHAYHVLVGPNIQARRIDAHQQWRGRRNLQFACEQGLERSGVLGIDHAAQLGFGFGERVGHHQRFTVDGGATEATEVDVQHGPTHVVGFAVIDAPAVDQCTLSRVGIHLVQFHEQLQPVRVFVGDMQRRVERGKHGHHGRHHQSAVGRDHVTDRTNVFVKAQDAAGPAAERLVCLLELFGRLVHGPKQYQPLG